MKKIVRLSLLVVPLLLGIVWYGTQGDSGHYNWKTAKIVRGDMEVVVTSTGKLAPTQVIDVGTQISGQVNQVYARTNDVVTKGQLLAEIDPSVLQSQLKESETAMESSRLNFEQAARDLKRTQTLLSKEYIAKVDLEHAEQAYQIAKNNYESSKTQVERAKVNLNYTKIYSPIDGVVLSQDVTLGQTLTASFSTPKMFTVASDMAKMKIEVIFSESDIVQIKVGMPVTFTVEAFRDRNFSGTVEKVTLSPGTQPNSSGYSAVVAVDNKEKLLFPGMTAYISVILSKKENVLHVPAAALRFTPPIIKSEGGGVISILTKLGLTDGTHTTAANNDKNIYILRNDRLVPVPVELGVMDESDVEVTGKDIEAGDAVVTGIVRDTEH